MAQVRGWVAPVLFVVLLVAFAAGIWGVYRAAYPGPGLHRVNGVYERRFTDLMISVRHEGIPLSSRPYSTVVTNTAGVTVPWVLTE